MRGFVELLRRRGRGTTVIRECRHCGTTLCESAERCPCCGRDEVAVYEFD
ncbi:hypothetical protein [Halospeciosus flavus]|uniref:Small CPxCG-related zinc finger protein n=1 Tax=Halospeciosus flavus TaxID=3032283 RepID=A0ABD5Z6H7_9EURY|nr:hypothetical protein [Halospeciosus flavus]